MLHCFWKKITVGIYQYRNQYQNQSNHLGMLGMHHGPHAPWLGYQKKVKQHNGEQLIAIQRSYMLLKWVTDGNILPDFSAAPTLYTDIVHWSKMENLSDSWRIGVKRETTLIKIVTSKKI